MALEGWEQRYAEGKQPSVPIPFITQTAQQLKPGRALDLACGTGRHALWLAERGWSVTAVDGSPSAIRILRDQAGELPIEPLLADLARRLDDPRVSLRPVIAAAGDQPDAIAIALNAETEAVLLDLVKPFRTSRNPSSNGGNAKLKRLKLALK